LSKTYLQPFSHKGKAFGYGSLFVPVQNQDMSSTEINNYLNEIISEYTFDITAVITGLDGIN
jgi:hypothetical protein